MIYNHKIRICISTKLKVTYSSSNIVNQSAFQIEMVTKRLDMEPTDKAGKNLGAV